MNRNEFMNELVSRLDKLPKEERYAAIKQYEKYFDEAGPDHEAEVIRRLGTPSQIVKKLMNDTKSEEKQKTRRWQEFTFVGIVILIIGGIAFAINDEINNNSRISTINVSKKETKDYVTKDINEDLKAFKNIEIESRYLEVNILEGENFKIEGKRLNKVEYNVEGDTFVLKQGEIKGLKNMFLEHVMSRNVGRVDLYIPKGTSLEDVQINGGMGKITLERREINTLEIEAGVGEVKLNDIQVGECNIVGGVGEIVANNVVTNYLDISTGVGYTEFEGSVEGDIIIEGGVGEVVLNLIGDEKQYNYIINQGVGGVSMNGMKYHKNNSGIRNSIEQDNGAPYNIEVNGGVGEVEINIHK